MKNLSTKEMEVILKGIAAGDRELKMMAGKRPNNFNALINKIKDENYHKFDVNLQAKIRDIKVDDTNGVATFNDVKSKLGSVFTGMNSVRFQEAINELNKKKSE